MKKLFFPRPVLHLALIVATHLMACWPARAVSTNLFPFVLPWDDASPGITDLSGWLHKPAGARGAIHVTNGHFFAGAERIRFLGVNVSFAGGMPAHSDAGKIAGRLAKFGINIVRFHHMDTSAWPNGLLKRGSRSGGELEPEALDRLDYFVAQLKQRGIYANINLLVGRRFGTADNLPAEIEKMDWKDQHVVGFWNAQHLESQRNFARRLLAHVNPYTGSSYANDPAIAFVEINNENGLVHAWLGGHVDSYPEVFTRDLQEQWNAWLKGRHATTSNLRQAWASGVQPLGVELLRNGNFARGTDGWNIEKHSGAQAEVSTDRPDVPGPASALTLRVTQPGAESWHLQLVQSGFALEAGKAYTVSFRAKSTAARKISVAVAQAHAPWSNLGLSADAALTQDWQTFRFVFNASQSDTNSRVTLSRFGDAGSEISIADASLKPGGVDGLAEDEEIGSVPRFEKKSFGRRTAEAQRDWMRFLTETEDRYWQAMYRFLKDELKVQAPIAGTIGGCSPLNAQAKLDWVDTHSYWQHPRFPRRQWDAGDWIVENKSMVNERGGTLPGLALKRILGKPHAVTEYNHAAPNTFASEGFLLLAAYAALQDWDAIYVYSYAHTRNGTSAWDSQKINGFFDVDQHPTKMATLVTAAAMFLRHDIRPAPTATIVDFPPEREIDLLRTASAWSLVDGSKLGVPRETALVERVALSTAGTASAAGIVAPRPGASFGSSSGELVWNLGEPGRGVVTINSPATKGVIGFGGGKKFKLGDIAIEPGETIQNGWSTVTVSMMSAQARQERPEPNAPLRWLITATGLAENTGMGWKNAEKNTVGRDWGSAPSVVEGVPARISFAVPQRSRAQAWALDARGQRAAEVPVVIANGTATVSVGPKWKTLWYEVQMQ